MIVARGLRQPPNYQDERLVDAPIGHFFDVMTNGYGAMYSYASRVPVDDRWRIAAYIRALQLSQGAAAQREPPEGKKQVTAPGGTRAGDMRIPEFRLGRKPPVWSGFREWSAGSGCCSAWRDFLPIERNFFSLICLPSFIGAVLRWAAWECC